jgi:hypothetical protein
MSRSWSEGSRDAKAGVKTWIRYHKRNPTEDPKITNPDKYLHAHARRRKMKDRHIAYLKG